MGTSFSEGLNMSKSIRLVLITLSIFSILNVMFVPLFDVWGGLFPSSPDDNFFEVVEMLFKDADHNWSLWVVQITVSIFVPCIFMLIFSLLGKRKLFIASTVIGILLWLRIIIQFISQNGASEVFDFDDGCISIGTWVAIIFFIVSFFVAISSKKKAENVVNQSLSEYSTQPITEKTICVVCGTANATDAKFCAGCGKNIESLNDNNFGLVNPDENKIRFCPKCGSEIKNVSTFCGQCGYKF